MILKDKTDQLIAAYLKNTIGFSPALTYNCKYFSVGEEMVAYLLNELDKAEKYIFLEYFQIEKGVVWNSVYDILKRKVAKGVDVRLLYDGVGCLFPPLPLGFRKNLEKAGIKVRIFRAARINIRNHRKIASIDGKIAFCGGLNLADQYANVKEMFGHFKDGGVMVDSTTAWNMTLMFLSMWEFITKEKVNYDELIPEFAGHNSPGVPFYQNTLSIPMLDIPKGRVSEHTFINFIARAEEYVYIMTPYLMCGSGILSVMSAAARSGVDIRIITPYIADKKLVKAVTESYYKQLLENKVRVFEYVPGFVHAKNLIADGKRAMVGTINLDYRSLYLHHECGICFLNGAVVDDIDRDFRETFAKCKEIRLDDLNKVSLFKRAIQRICRLFAPFL